MYRGKSKILLALLCPIALCLSVVGLAGTGGFGTAAMGEGKSALGQDGGSLILVLDGSGSMKEKSGGQTRMEAARKGLNGVIDKLPDDSSVGLRVYGSTISDGPGSCKDSTLLVPVDKVDKAKLKSGVNKLKPLGNTPIAYSLEQAAKDLPKEGPRSIVLVSDGEENCGGNPCKVARDLKKAGANFYVDVVGLQVDATSRNQLTCIASAGGGTYYDVKSLDQLESTLTRTSVRAARGYEPAGFPVEGGTDSSSAPDIGDGQWLDTIGDTGTEFYLLPDPGKGTLHVGAATPPSVESSTSAESLKIAVFGANGQACGQGATSFVQGASNANAPLTAAYSATEKVRESCGKGPYYLSVEAPDVNGVKSLEVLVRTEPPVESTKGLPPAAAYTGFSDQVQGNAPAATPVSAIGAPNFSAAPPTAVGTYSDSILSGETLFYRVPDVGWGQQLVCDFTVASTPAAKKALGDRGYQMSVRSRAYGPMKSGVVDAASTRAVGLYTGSAELNLQSATPQVRYLDRDSGQSTTLAASLDGNYYCAITSLVSVASVQGQAGEIPFTLTISTVGTAGEGKPDYLAKPANDKNADEKNADPDGSTGVSTYAAVGVAILALLALIWAFLRRRRSTA